MIKKEEALVAAAFWSGISSVPCAFQLERRVNQQREQ